MGRQGNGMLGWPHGITLQWVVATRVGLDIIIMPMIIGHNASRRMALQVALLNLWTFGTRLVLLMDSMALLMRKLCSPKTHWECWIVTTHQNHCFSSTLFIKSMHLCRCLMFGSKFFHS